MAAGVTCAHVISELLSNPKQSFIVVSFTEIVCDDCFLTMAHYSLNHWLDVLIIVHQSASLERVGGFFL